MVVDSQLRSLAGAVLEMELASTVKVQMETVPLGEGCGGQGVGVL